MVRHGGLAGFFAVGFGREVGRISGGRGQQELPAADRDDDRADGTCPERAADGEQCEVRWVPAAEAIGYEMDRSMRIRINDFLAGKKSHLRKA